MRRPTARELNALRSMMPGYIEKEGSIPGVGKVTFDKMIALGWIEWVDSPQTNEKGYRITESGIEAKS